jgi:hypothetical protein
MLAGVYYYPCISHPFMVSSVQALQTNFRTYVSAADLRQGTGWVNLIHFAPWQSIVLQVSGLDLPFGRPL